MGDKDQLGDAIHEEPCFLSLPVFPCVSLFRVALLDAGQGRFRFGLLLRPWLFWTEMILLCPRLSTFTCLPRPFWVLG